MTESDILRGNIAELHRRRRDGDVSDRDFQKQSADGTLALYRSEIRLRLAEGENIVCEHHVISAHTALHQSILQEPEQQAVSLFLTDHRLIRLRSTILADRPITCDESDGTVIDEIYLSDLKAALVRLEIRVGEIIAGLSIAVFAFVFSSWLVLTSKVMIALGLIGCLHATIFPTRRLEIASHSGQPADPIVIYGLRRSSARKMRKRIEQRIAENHRAGS